jgi:SAM-dependent methyltransferase
VDFDEYYRTARPTEDHDEADRWHSRNPIGFAYRVQLERAVLRAVRAMDRPLESCRVLEVGCGAGRRLRYFAEIGVPPDKLTGLEILESRVAHSREMNPKIDVVQCDAGLGFPLVDASFDLVTQFVALSSILDHDARRAAAHEMVRCTMIGGWVLTYELRRSHPGVIPDGIPTRDVAGLFPDVRWLHRQSLHNLGLPKLAAWPFLSALAELVPVLKTNYLWLGQRVR